MPKERIIKEGQLAKEGFVVRNWRERNFVLTCTKLSYYNGNTLKGTIKLKGASVAIPNATGDNCTFELSTGSRIYFLRADTQSLCNAWMNSIKEQINLTTILKEGKLSKKGKIVTAWRQRLFHLTALQLEYFRDEKDNELAGTISLYKAEISLPAPSESEELCFTFITPSRTYQLRAESKEERNQWIDSITKAIIELESIKPFNS